MQRAFDAFEYHADQSLGRASFVWEGAQEEGWTLTRNCRPSLRLGPGYRLMRSSLCGVCSTDLARAFLPFPLPQITGHELIACDEAGTRFAVEINAGHAARRRPLDCPFCSRGLGRHCPDRLVLGIHDLPGGFGPWVAAPVGGLVEVPPLISDEAAAMIEPLAAALNAVTSVELRPGDRVAVLGPRKLGMMIVAALDAHRRRLGLRVELSALARRDSLRRLALGMGADQAVDPADLDRDRFEVVFDTTGSPEGLETALRLAGREVHLKSTHGRPAAGLEHLTEMVVDEIGLAPFGEDAIEALQPVGGRARPWVGWIGDDDPPASLLRSADVLRAPDAESLLESVERGEGPDEFPRLDAVVADSRRSTIEALRPSNAREISPVRPRGAILYRGPAGAQASILSAIVERGLRVSTSRCGDFHAAVDLMRAEPGLIQAAERMITRRFNASEVPQAFEAARSTDCIKAIVRHSS